MAEQEIREMSVEKSAQNASTKGFSLAAILALALSVGANYVNLSYNQHECFKTVIRANPGATVTALPADAYQFTVRYPDTRDEKGNIIKPGLIKIVHTDMISAEILVDYVVPPATDNDIFKVKK